MNDAKKRKQPWTKETLRSDGRVMLSYKMAAMVAMVVAQTLASRHSVRFGLKRHGQLGGDGNRSGLSGGCTVQPVQRNHVMTWRHSFRGWTI